MNIYREKRHLVRDQGNEESIRDTPDIGDVEMIAFDIF